METVLYPEDGYFTPINGYLIRPFLTACILIKYIENKVYIMNIFVNLSFRQGANGRDILYATVIQESQTKIPKVGFCYKS